MGEGERERYHKLLEHLIIVAAGEHKLAGIELEETNAYRPACVIRQHTSAYVSIRIELEETDAHRP